MVSSCNKKRNFILIEITIQIPLPPSEIQKNEIQKWINFYSEKLNETNEKWLKDIYAFLFLWINENDFIEISTSGSTGTPKIIQVKKESMRFSAKQTIAYFGFKENEKWLLCLPAKFIGGQMVLVRAILSGTKIFACEPKIDFSFTNEFDFASMTPMQADKYCHSEFKIKKILIGGAAIPKQIENKLKKTKKTDFYASYGMTETVSHIALRKVNGNDSSDYFTPFKNILLSTDERGCLTIYNRNYSENVIVTNDLVAFDMQNRFQVLGRADTIINSGGLKIIPEVIEKILEEIIPSRLIISSLPDSHSGEKVVLFIEGEPFDNATMHLLRNFMEQNIEKNKIPKEIIFLDKLRETEGGKVNRKETREGYLRNLDTHL